MSQKIEVRVPDIGDYRDVPVIEMLVAEGDAVEQDAPLLVLESDKSTMEVPAPEAGVVRGLKLKVDDKVSQGDLICALETSAATGRSTDEGVGQAMPAEADVGRPVAAETLAAPAESKPKADAAPPAVPEKPASGQAGVPYAGPATRKFARELGVDLGQVKGSGRKGRIVIEDVQAFVKSRMRTDAIPAANTNVAGIPPIPEQDFSRFGEIDVQPLGRIRKISAAHLHRSWLNVPHVTQTDEADITDLETFRKSASAETGTKLTLLPFIMKAVAQALRDYPDFNASLSGDGTSLIYKKYCHVGFAADTPNGLLVPVVRDVWDKGITALAQETAALAGKARDGKLRPDEMKGGCFSISSLGGIGGSHFTPIVNAPEVGILGVSRGVMKPVWDGSAFQPRMMVPLSLSYDHRVIDGAYAARFIVHLVKLLSDLRRLSL